MKSINRRKTRKINVLRFRVDFVGFLREIFHLFLPQTVRMLTVMPTI